SPGSARSAAAARRSSGTGRPPGHTADTPTRTPAARRTTGNPGAGTPPRGQPPHTHRPIAGTAIRWPRATHRLGSLLATVAKRGEEGSLTSERDGKILARQRQPDSNIAKEHSREPGQDGQRIRPSTPGPASVRSACASPYARTRHKALTCAGCEQNRRHLATGLCARCFRLSRTRLVILPRLRRAPPGPFRGPVRALQAPRRRASRKLSGLREGDTGAVVGPGPHL